MTAIYGLVNNMITQSDIPQWSMAAMCARAAAVACMINYFIPEFISGYISDLFVVQSSKQGLSGVADNAACLAAGRGLREIFGKNAGVRTAALILAIVAGPYRFLERTRNVQRESNNVHSAFFNKYTLHQRDDLKVTWTCYWISPSFETWVKLECRQKLLYLVNLAKHLSCFFWEVMGQASALNDFVMTVLWDGCSERNIGQIVCNFKKVLELITNDEEEWKEMILSNPETVKMGMELLGKKMSVEELVREVERARPVIKTLNFLKEGMSFFSGKGVRLMANTFNLGGWLPNTPTKGHQMSPTASPFIFSPDHKKMLRKKVEDSPYLSGRLVRRQLFPT